MTFYSYQSSMLVFGCSVARLVLMGRRSCIFSSKAPPASEYQQLGHEQESSTGKSCSSRCSNTSRYKYYCTHFQNHASHWNRVSGTLSAFPGSRQIFSSLAIIDPSRHVDSETAFALWCLRQEHHKIRCLSCKVMSYCGLVHQKAHRKVHSRMHQGKRN